MNVICTGFILLGVLYFAILIGKKIYEPFEPQINKIHNTNTKEDIGLLPIPLQSTIQAQELNYGDLNKYIYRTPMASYEQVTNNRKWTTPENGSALFPPINGTSLYRS
jgi:hypothetical protein